MTETNATQRTNVPTRISMLCQCCFKAKYTIPKSLYRKTVQYVDTSSLFYKTYFCFHRLEPACWIILNKLWKTINPTLSVWVPQVRQRNTSLWQTMTKSPFLLKIIIWHAPLTSYSNCTGFATWHIPFNLHRFLIFLKMFMKCLSLVGEDLKLWSSFQSFKHLSKL